MVESGASFYIDAATAVSQTRSGLVKIDRGVDSALFGGWGVRI